MREGVEVTSLEPGQDGRFRLETSAGEMSAEDGGPLYRCVPATAPAREPPRCPPTCFRSTSRTTGTPRELPPGPVLVVGSGQSGCQIAEELHLAGRQVFLACGRAPWAPRRLGDHDFIWWAVETGFLDAPLSSLPSPAARLAANPQTTGNGGGHDLHYRTLRKLGVTLLGHFLGAEGRHARFAPDLDASVAWGDQRYRQFMDLVRKLVAERGLPRPEIPEPAPFSANAPDRLDLSGFGAVIFAGGFRPDYQTWVRFPGAFDELGFPIHKEGASTVVGVSTSWACTSSANGSRRSSSAWARTPPSSPARSPRDRSDQPRRV